MKSIVITGPESSGKTTLLRALRKELDAIYVPEYSRVFLADKNIDVQFHHVLKIAEGQLDLYEKAKISSPSMLICDTDLLVLNIWCILKFPDFDFRKFYSWENRPVDLYLLCRPDILWEEDTLREDPAGREEIFEVYQKCLIKANKPFEIIEGDHEQRLERALSKIEELST